MSSSNWLINGGVSSMFHNQFCKWTVNGWWMDAKHLALGVFLWPLRGFKVAMAACEKMARWQQLLTLLTEMFGPRCLVLCGSFFPLLSSGFEPDTHQSLRRTYRMVANARSPTAAANAMHDMVKYDDIEPLWGLRKPGLGVTLKYEQLMMGCPSTEWALDPNLPKAVWPLKGWKAIEFCCTQKSWLKANQLANQRPGFGELARIILLIWMLDGPHLKHIFYCYL